MVRRSMPTCLTLALVMTAFVTTSNVALADRCGSLVFATEQLRYSVECFERIACRRPLPRHDLHKIRQLSQKACRLADAVSHAAPHGKVVAEACSVRTLIQLIDRRLRRLCALDRDPVLRRNWDAVCRDLATVDAALNGQTHGRNRVQPPAVERPPVPQVPDPRAQGARYSDSRFRRSRSADWIDVLRLVVDRL